MIDHTGLPSDPIDDKASPMKQTLISIAKWGWFCLLMLVAFGYMAAGLSREDSRRAGSRVVETLADSAAGLPTDDGDESDQPDAARSESERSTLNGTGGHQGTGTQGTGPKGTGGSTSAADEEWMSVVDAVNAARGESLSRSGLEPAGAADWMTVCRRLSLAMVGSGMSLEEIRLLEQLPPEHRSGRHLENLLSDPRFHDYWAERWTRYLVGADEGPFIVYRRRRFRHWLSDQLAANQPYDRIVRDLITAEGLWTDRPEVNYVTVTFDSNDGQPDPIRLAARTSRAFLGLRIDCLQCHNDFLGNVNLGGADGFREGLQTDFHQLAAFYSSAKTNGLQGVKTGDVDYQYQYLDSDQEVAVEAAVPFASELLPDQGDPRSRLAAWVTHQDNRQFSRAAVVRFWSLMFGRAPTDAVDNLPLDEPLPDQLEPIIDDFQRHRNVRRTIRIIAMSDAFHAASQADFEITPAHEQQFAAFPLTRLRAEQVAGSIVQASKIKSINRDSSLLVQLIRFGSINDFLKRYGDLGENEFSKDGITIPQRLLMLNGKMLRESGEPNPVLNATGHIDMFAPDDESAVDVLFLCLLNRYPDADERAYFADRISAGDDRGRAIEDLYWTLANGTEFVWNH